MYLTKDLYSLCVIDIYGKNACVISLKDKKGNTIANAFQKILEESNHKPNKIWVDKCSGFYDRSKTDKIKTRKKWHRNLFNP